KGWTGPKTVDGVPVEGTWRAHQVPLGAARDDPAHLAQLERWMRSYRPEGLFDHDGAPRGAGVDWLPRGGKRVGAAPDATGGKAPGPLELPEIADYAVKVAAPGDSSAEPTRVLSGWLRDALVANEPYHNLRLVGPDETESNRLGAVYEVTDKVW